MVTNQKDDSRLEQRSVMKYLVSKKCKTYEFTEECVKCMEKNVLFTNKLNMGLPLKAKVEKQKSKRQSIG